jgi:hypothetical protein
MSRPAGIHAQPALRRAYALFKGVSSRVCKASGTGAKRRGRVMMAAAARVPLRRKVRVSSASRLTCGSARAPSGSEWLCAPASAAVAPSRGCCRPGRG